MHRRDILLPKPVWIITPAIKKALTTSQVVESPYPFKATLIGINPYTVEKIRPPSTLNAIEICCNKREKMTDKKTMNILYPWTLSPSGGLRNHNKDIKSKG